MSPSSAKEQSTKTTTAARVALNTGPAASSAEARKNKRKTQNIVMEDTNRTSPFPCEEDRTPKRPRTIHPMSPTTNGDSHTSPSQTSESDTIAKMQNRLEAIAKCTHTKTTNRDSQRDPIDKYTVHDSFPTVHEAHPAAALDNIDVQRAVDWVQRPGGKLLAIPFDNEAQNINAHHMIKSKIFTAATEITKADNIGISGPTPSKDARRSPTSFLIYNLTEAQRDTLLQHGVWSSSDITFRVTSLYPPCPDFLFTIRGFTTHIIEEVQITVLEVWTDNVTRDFIHNTINSFEPPDRPDVASSIQQFLNAVRISYLELKSSGGNLSPHFNVYSSGHLIAQDDLWFTLRDFLASRTYTTSLQGDGDNVTTPFHCGVCHGVDHPRGLCPFPGIKGWNGPKLRPNTANAPTRGGPTRKGGKEIARYV
ncbi:hypothetical protein F5148DRAFT_1150290 [Russula earlei]|uniref:Uncharacterized protein n=1 Tax=Russula earlei TaxID=71964 RepID=A0ACC0U5D5_9AGAM|nr:hypothetical protein F5148DRAFT_1150290 [Russula earlei]